MYSLSGFGSGAYTISPSKIDGSNGAVSGFDAAKVAQYVVNLIQLSASQIAAADVSGANGVTSYDATLIARHTSALPPPTGSSGTWVFNPVSISHQAIYSNLANQNYTAMLMGDVSANWNSPTSLPGRSANSSGPERSVVVNAPTLLTQEDGDIIIPVKIQNAAGKGIISYEFDLRYDPSVIQPQSDPVSLNRTVSRGLSAVSNASEPGMLRVTVFGPAAIDVDGTLLNLRFTAVGASGSVSPLTWERMVLNEGDPRAIFTNGRVEISSASSSQAEISGRVLTPFGEGISNARVTLTSTTGRSRSVVSNGFGYYRFASLQTGETYTIGVSSKQHSFSQLTISASGQITTQDIIAQP